MLPTAFASLRLRGASASVIAPSEALKHFLPSFSNTPQVWPGGLPDAD